MLAHIVCDYCGEPHTVTYSHDCPFTGRRMFETECPVDLLTDYYAEERVTA